MILITINAFPMTYNQATTGLIARKLQEAGIPGSVLHFIRKWINLQGGQHANLGLSSFFDPEFPDDFEEKDLSTLIHLERLNDKRYVNKFLESVNERLRSGGYFIGCVETAEQRRDRILQSMSKPFNLYYYFFFYLAKRVWPKMPYLKQLYFELTKGRDRVISEMEMYGRLYSCGYALLDKIEAGGKLYFIAEKKGDPEFNTQATYGPFIKLRRLGKNGRMVRVYKLRTMCPYAEYLQEFIYERNGLQSGGKLKDDPRINAVGRFLRRYWLDEIPMLINFLKGELKVFGVRPISPHYMSLYPEEFQEYRKKFKPGLIPPVYVDYPKTLDDVIESERNYLRAYERQPLMTDLRYTYKAIVNIFFKRVRSH